MSKHVLSADQKQTLQDYYASELRELDAAKIIKAGDEFEIQCVEKNLICIVLLLVQQRGWNWSFTPAQDDGLENWTMLDEEGEYPRIRVSITCSHIAVDNYNIYGDFNILMNILNLKNEIVEYNYELGGRRMQIESGRRTQSVLGEMHNKKTTKS